MSLDATADVRPGPDRDRGAILLLVLAVSIVLSLVVLALANFVAADLRYAQVVDTQAKRLASAESGIDYAVDRLRLNQTLCATDVANSAVNLNGASSPGTPLPAPLNGTDTRITCKRLDGAIADVAGWAVIIADPLAGGPNDRLRVDGDGTALVSGPVFLPNPNAVQTDSNSIFGLDDADLWYTDPSNCADPKLLSELPTGLVVGPAISRGPECTTRPWSLTDPLVSELFSTPLFLGLPTNVAGDADGDGDVDVDRDVDLDNQVDGVLVGGCLVFSPGLYTMRPDIPPGTRAYFQSGQYHLDFDVEWAVDSATVWVGEPAAGVAPEVANSNCVSARNADILDTSNGVGATFYFDRNSRLRIDGNGEFEMFPRQQGAYMMSVQALPTSTTGNTTSLIRTRPDGTEIVRLVIRGLVWAPDGRFAFDNDQLDTLQKLLGGIVVGRLWTLRFHSDGFEIRPATSTVDTKILLTSTSKTLADGVSTTVEAVVAYRPHAPDLEDRVAVTSFRVVD